MKKVKNMLKKVYTIVFNCIYYIRNNEGSCYYERYKKIKFNLFYD